jgi:hypothetical protein
MRAATFVCLAAIGMLAAGCGSGNDITKVSGQVSFNGGPPPRPGRIAFSLVPGTGREGLPYRPGSAAFGVDGKYAATTFEKGDGLLPGTYNVNIICISELPGQTRSYNDVSLVPAGWAPEPVVVTGAERSIEVNFDVPPKKSR